MPGDRSRPLGYPAGLRSLEKHKAMNPVLSVAEMYEADAAAMEAGVPGLDLMDNAGRAVAEAIQARWPETPVMVLCGPGNNGGDGFVAARYLAEAGWPVRLALLGDPTQLSGDAAHHAGLWLGKVKGEVEPLIEEAVTELLEDAGLVVDALFGAGLTRPLEGVARAAAEVVKLDKVPVVAVDIPSGVSGDSGEALGGVAFEAALTVTFFRKKPGHLLLPGRDLCGELLVVDIGIPETVLDGIAARTLDNEPALWLDRYPWRRAESHKYEFGHVLILGGAVMTGAGRLAARAALRVGAGLVTVACTAETLPIYALESPSLITAPVAVEEDFHQLLADERKNAILIGPGNGAGGQTRARALAALETGRAVVLDADALTSFQDQPRELFEAVEGPCVLTPHEGEFARLFPGLRGDKLTRARSAADLSGAVVLLKGADSVIAAPGGPWGGWGGGQGGGWGGDQGGGWTAINGNAPPTLATAGSGDVLAGLIAGLLAQGMTAFDAACAAAWIQGEAGSILGLGLISEDIPDILPLVLEHLQE